MSDFAEIDLNTSAVHLIHRASQAASELFAARAGKTGITPRQFAVLVTVAQNEGLSQTGLVDRTGIDRSTLADIIRRMIQRGLLQRKRTRQDARAYAVRLSEHGREILQQAIPAVQLAEQELLAELSEDERRTLINMLARFSERGPDSEK